MSNLSDAMADVPIVVDGVGTNNIDVPINSGQVPTNIELI
jgi:hypothetical protein